MCLIRCPTRLPCTISVKNDIIGYINKDPIYYDLIDVIVIRLNGKTEVSDPVMELFAYHRGWADGS